jgi:hypothetical protein
MGAIAAWIAILSLGALQEPKAKDELVIHVAAEGWGDVGVEEVTKVLESAAHALWTRVPGREQVTLEVSRTDKDPITLFKRGPSGEIRIKLNAEGRRWSRFAFQFGHEVGHVLCGYADYPNPNLWFEETLCEAASLFVLGRMAESWASTPPYPNWKDYSASHREYREERMTKAKLPEGKGFPEWFREREPSLRKDPRQRDRNLVMAAVLLPLFEEDPSRWEAVAGLNAVRGDADRSFPQYLRDWLRSTPEKEHAFIRKVADRFGVTIAP